MRVRRDIRERREGEGRAAAAGEGRADLAGAIDQLGVGGEPRERDAAARRAPRASTRPSSVVRSSARMIVPSARPAADRESAREARVVGGQMRVDPLRLPPTGEKSSVPPSVPPASVRRPVKPPGSERRSSARVRAAGIERCDGDHRRPPVRQQDLAVAGERPELRSAAGAIVEAGRGRIEQQLHRRGCRASRWGGRGTGRACGRSICPSSDQLQRPVFRLPARARRCGRCRRGCAGPRRTAAAWANRAAGS